MAIVAISGTNFTTLPEPLTHKSRFRCDFFSVSVRGTQVWYFSAIPQNPGLLFPQQFENLLHLFWKTKICDQFLIKMTILAVESLEHALLRKNVGSYHDT